MKNVKSFDIFINEGIRDKMTPKSEEEIINSVKYLNIDDQLIMGVMDGVVSLVKYALKNDANVHYLDDMSIRYICDMYNRNISINDRKEIIKMLIDAGADVNKGYGVFNGHTKREEELYNFYMDYAKNNER